MSAEDRACGRMLRARAKRKSVKMPRSWTSSTIKCVVPSVGPRVRGLTEFNARGTSSNGSHCSRRRTMPTVQNRQRVCAEASQMRQGESVPTCGLRFRIRGVKGLAVEADLVTHCPPRYLQHRHVQPRVS